MCADSEVQYCVIQLPMSYSRGVQLIRERAVWLLVFVPTVQKHRWFVSFNQLNWWSPFSENKLIDWLKQVSRAAAWLEQKPAAMRPFHGLVWHLWAAGSHPHHSALCLAAVELKQKVKHNRKSIRKAEVVNGSRKHNIKMHSLDFAALTPAFFLFSRFWILILNIYGFQSIC